jgi:hypothetical protein
LVAMKRAPFSISRIALRDRSKSSARLAEDT